MSRATDGRRGQATDATSPEADLQAPGSADTGASWNRLLALLAVCWLLVPIGAGLASAALTSTQDCYSNTVWVPILGAVLSAVVSMLWARHLKASTASFTVAVIGGACAGAAASAFGWFVQGFSDCFTF